MKLELFLTMPLEKLSELQQLDLSDNDFVKLCKRIACCTKLLLLDLHMTHTI